MADIATPEFLERLQAIYPRPPQTAASTTAYIANPWYLLATVSASAAGVPEAVPIIFKAALVGLERIQQLVNTSENDAHAEKLQLARKVREGVLQSGMLAGLPRTINSLVALNAMTPDDLKEKEPLRDVNKSLADYDANGKKLFGAIYGESAPTTQTLLYNAYPDLGWFCSAIGYGLVYGGTDVLTQTECSFVQIAALVAVDAARQIGWHLTNVQRNGVSKEEATAVRTIAMEVAQRAGVVWRAGVPDVE